MTQELIVAAAVLQSRGSIPLLFWLILIFFILILFLWGVTSVRSDEAKKKALAAASVGADAESGQPEVENGADNSSEFAAAAPGELADTNGEAVDSETDAADSAPAAPAAIVDEPDDLKKIEGIGPKISQILNDASILTYQQLAETSVADLKDIVVEKGGIRLTQPDSWPEQAAFAAAGDWEGLTAYQDGLKGGRQE